MTEIKAFTIADLKEAIGRESFWETRYIPISKHKAISHINNPKANDSDVALLVAYEEREVAGFLGILAGRIFIDGTAQKFGWLTTWWVEPSHRGIGVSLLRDALKRYDKSIGISGFNEAAGNVYAKLKFFMPLKRLEGTHILFHPNSENRLPAKVPALRFAQPFFHILDCALHGISMLRLRLWRRCHRDLYKKRTIEYISQIDKETECFINEHRENELAQRDASELNWILQYPWVLPAVYSDRLSRKYPMSSLVDRFLFVNVKIFNANNKMVGFVMFKVCNNCLSLPYVYYDAAYNKYIACVIVDHVIGLGIEDVYIYDSQLRESCSDIPFVFRKNMHRDSVISTKFKDVDFGPLHLQDGDGDTAFV